MTNWSNLWMVTAVIDGNARPSFLLPGDVQGILTPETALKYAVGVLGIDIETPYSESGVRNAVTVSGPDLTGTESLTWTNF